MPNKELLPLCPIILKDITVKNIQGQWPVIENALCEQYRERTATAFITMVHGLCLTRFQEGRFLMPDWMPLEAEYLRSIRVFTEESESYVWNSSVDMPDNFNLRIREEGSVQAALQGDFQAIDARQLLWGTVLTDCSADNQWKIIKEDRGIELLIHRSILADDVKISPTNRLWLITRNYIDYTPSGQAGYIDSRFVRLEDERGKAM